MSLKGNLASVNLTEIFQMLSLSGREGTLFIYEGSRKRAICFTREGVSIRSRERNESNLIGKLLVRMGAIDEEDLTHAIEKKRATSKLLGDVLVESGSCTKDQIEAAFRAQSQEDIQELFLNRTDAQFEYVDGYFPETDAPFVDLNVNQLLIEIARRTDEWEYIRRRIRGPREIYRFTGTEGEVDANVLEECYSHRIDALIDGARAVSDIIDDSYVNQFEVCKLLAAYLDAEIVEPVPTDAIRQNARLALRMGDAESAVRHYEYLMTAGDFPLELMAEAAEAHEANRDFSEAAALLRRLADELVRDGDNRGAMDALRRIANYPRAEPEALRTFLDLVFANPRSAVDFEAHVIEAGKCMVAHYLKCDQRSEAQMLLERLLAMYPEEISFAVALVDIFYEQGNVARATSECEKMAQAFLRRKRVSPAISLYKKLLVIDPERQDIRDKVRKIVSGKKRKGESGGVLPRVMISLALALLIGGAAIVFIRRDTDSDTARQRLDADTLKALIARAQTDAGIAGTHARTAMREHARLLEMIAGQPLKLREDITSGLNLAGQNLEQFELQAKKAEQALELIREQAADEQAISMARAMLSTIHDQRGNVNAEAAKWTRRARNAAHSLYEQGDRLYKEAQLLAALERFELAHLVYPNPEWLKESNLVEYIRNIRRDRDQAVEAMENSRALEARGDFVGARRIILRLVEEFRNADIIKDVRLPVRLVTVPSGASIELDGNALPVKTPHVVRLNPFRATQVSFNRKGFVAQNLALGPYLESTDPEKLDYVVPLGKKPTFTAEVGDRLDATPIYWDGKIGAIGRNGKFAILNSRTGKVIRAGAIKGDEGFTAGLVAHGDRVLAASLDRKLYTINAATGAVGRRSLPVNSGVYVAPLLIDGVLYIVDLGGMVVALDVKTLEPRWEQPARTAHGVREHLDLITQGDDLIVSTRDGKVSVIRLKDGVQSAPTYSLRGPIKCAPAPVGTDKLIFAGEQGWVEAWNRSGSERLWDASTGDGTKLGQTFSVRGRAAFCSPRPRELLSFDLSTGDIVHRYRHTALAARLEVAPTERLFFVQGRTLTAYATTKNGYGPAWSFEAQGQIVSGPIEADGAVFVGDDKGYLYRLEAEDR